MYSKKGLHKNDFLCDPLSLFSKPPAMPVLSKRIKEQHPLSFGECCSAVFSRLYLLCDLCYIYAYITEIAARAYHK